MKFLNKRPIALIDSGIGGVSILKQLISKNKNGNYVYYADNLYMPYGNKSKEEIKQRIDYIIKLLQEKYNAQTIIIACNTASASINPKDYTNVITLTFNKESVYFATNLTKQNLKDIKVIADDNLPMLIENNIFNKNKLKAIIKEKVNIHKLNKYKQIVLACTHYELVLNLFNEYAPNTKFICNSTKIVDNINIEEANGLNITLLTSKKSKKIEDVFYKLLN